MTPTRRQVFGATAGCAALGLAGCSAATSTAPTLAKAITLAATEVPVGGGIVLKDAKIVITQPANGTFKAFSAVCPHAGCTVRDVPADGIFCACHGSVFKPDDGSVVRGPATTGLPALPIKVEGDTLTIG